MGNFWILIVTCILAASYVNGDDLSSPDCQYLFSKMSNCLDYLVPDSNQTRPSYLCCYDLIGILYPYPQCSCYAIRKSIRMELDLNYTRLFTLDSVCQLNIPPVDCRISFPINPPIDSLQDSPPKNIASSTNVPNSVSPTIAPAAPSPEPKTPSSSAPAPATAVETPSPPPQAPNSASETVPPTPESVQPRSGPVLPAPAPATTLQGHYSQEVLAPAPVPVPAPAPTAVPHSGGTSMAVACDTILLISLLFAAFSYAFA